MVEMKKGAALFLDRDGVINTELPADYVKTWDEFRFEEGAIEALRILQPRFEKTIIVTNQRGVGAGIMTEEALDFIHAKMLSILREEGIHVDKIYAATDEDRQSPRRKPHPYMGHLAQTDFPAINFSASVMVGNSLSDMQFGHALGMCNVFIDDKKRYENCTDVANAHFEFDSLLLFARAVEKGTFTP